jgi:FkbM family methyltransferase
MNLRMQNPIRLLVLLNTHFKTLGINGIILLFKRILYKNRIIKIKIKGYPYPIFLRNNTSDITVFYQIFLEKSYTINYRVEPKVIVDCGANIGLSSIFYKIKFPNSVIYAIEPETSNFNLMKKNTQFIQDIVCINGGIWNKPTNLIIENNSTEKWGFKVSEVGYSNKNTVRGLSIACLMKKYQFNSIDIMKIDIEGSEKELFELNFESWLSKTKVLLIELHDGYRKGASKTFFKALNNYDYSMIKKNENLIFYIE